MSCSGVVVDRRVLLVDVHRHDRVAVLVGDAADLADLDTRDVDRLPLARGDRRAGRELGPDRVVALEQRERGLVEQDVPGNHDRAENERDDRGEVLPVDDDCALHGPIPVLALFRLGSGFS
jgi:hypothetical protein